MESQNSKWFAYAAQPPESMTVAVVDDFKNGREFMNHYLPRLGYDVVCTATDGLDFLEQLGALPKLPDVCLLDFRMPVMDGYETARKLREEYPRIGIVAFPKCTCCDKPSGMLRCGAHEVIRRLAPDPDELHYHFFWAYQAVQRLRRTAFRQKQVQVIESEFGYDYFDDKPLIANNRKVLQNKFLLPLTL